MVLLFNSLSLSLSLSLLFLFYIRVKRKERGHTHKKQVIRVTQGLERGIEKREREARE